MTAPATAGRQSGSCCCSCCHCLSILNASDRGRLEPMLMCSQLVMADDASAAAAAAAGAAAAVAAAVRVSEQGQQATSI